MSIKKLEFEGVVSRASYDNQPNVEFPNGSIIIRLEGQERQIFLTGQRVPSILAGNYVRGVGAVMEYPTEGPIGKCEYILAKELRLFEKLGSKLELAIYFGGFGLPGI